MRKVFISYVGEDKSYALNMYNWQSELEDKKIVFNIDFLKISKEKKESITEEEVTGILGKMIKESNAIIILIGNDTHNKPWIEWEYKFAKSNKLKIGLMRVPNSTGAPLKKITKSEVFKMTFKNLRKIIENWGWK